MWSEERRKGLLRATFSKKPFPHSLQGCDGCLSLWFQSTLCLLQSEFFSPCSLSPSVNYGDGNSWGWESYLILAPGGWYIVVLCPHLVNNWHKTAQTECDMTQFSSVAQSCPTLCNPMDCSMLGFPVHHQPVELAETQVHWVGDAIQLSPPL